MAYLPNSIQRVIEEGYTFQTGEYIRRGWYIVQKNMGNFVAFLLVYLFIQILLAIIPVLGTIAGLILNPALALGPFIVADKISRNQPTSFNDFFKGMDKFGDLLVTYIFQVIIVLGASIPGFILLIVGGLSLESVDGFEGLSSMIWVGLLVILVPVVYVGVSYSLALQFVWFYDLRPWDAMEASRKIVAKNWWAFFGFFIILGLIALGGLIALFIGLLFALPLVWCSFYAAFASITGRDKEDREEESDIADHLIIN